ncbi:MAG: hypothetical protein M1817_005028 [Caeruleum heppii]|nr:MAG: hypothetical protein M1817_005028 [Caeruleum heppii]
MSISGDVDDLAELGHSNEHQPCYIYQPTTTRNTSPRPAKRQKVEDPKKRGQTDHDHPHFVRLLEGKESPKHVTLRYDTFRAQQAELQDRVNDVLKDLNVGTVQEVTAFVRDAAPEKCLGKLPVGCILAGPGIASHGRLFEQIASAVSSQTRDPLVVLTSGEAPNLKGILKGLISKATKQNDGDAQDDRASVAAGAAKLLNYDLRILHNYIKQTGAQKVVVAFQDGEAFDGNLLAELVALFNSWLDRIPFVLLFGIATSLEIFQSKLPRAAIRCLQGKTFDVERAEESLERVFSSAMGRTSALRLGPGLSRMLLQRQRDHVQSVAAFVNSLKYAYMCHFYSNPLSVLLAGEEALRSLQPEHLQAIRNTRSFRRNVETRLEKKDFEAVRALLDDENYLLDEVRDSLEDWRQAELGILDAFEIIGVLVACLGTREPISKSNLYVLAVAGDLQDSSIMRELLLTVPKLSSDKLTHLLQTLSSLTLSNPQINLDLGPILHDLHQLTHASDSSTPTTLHSTHALRHANLRTTIIAQKVHLSHRPPNLSAQDTAYAALLDRTHALLAAYFSATLINPQHMFLHEAFLYDIKKAHRDVFTPRPRAAVERALSRPGDYLGCACCGGGGGGDGNAADTEGLSASQPATAIVYQLYLESGSLINVFDLWSAFFAIVGRDEGKEGDVDRAEGKEMMRALALFYRAFADLRFLGLIKHSKKKTDHLAKLAWKGL